MSSKSESSDGMDLKSLTCFLTNAVDRGTLFKEDGNYKVTEAASRKKSGDKKSLEKCKRTSGSSGKKTMSRKKSAGQKTDRKHTQSAKKMRAPKEHYTIQKS